MITCVCCEPAHKIKHLLPTCMRHLLLDMYVPTAKSAKNDDTLVKTIITNHVCIIQVATIYSAIFDMVIIYTLQEIYNLLTVLAGRKLFFPLLPSTLSSLPYRVSATTKKRYSDTRSRSQSRSHANVPGGCKF